MISFLEFLPKELAIIVILSPFFLSVILLTRFLLKMWSKAERYPLYWILLTLVLAFFTGSAFVGRGEYSTFMLLGSYASGAYATYLSMVKKKTK